MFGYGWFVGLFGGIIYVNAMFLIMETDKVPKERKELAVGMALIVSDIGVISAGIVSLAFDNLYFYSNTQF